MLRKFLLGRGINRAQELASKALRHGLTTYGGVLLASDEVETVYAAGVILIGAALSAVRSFIEER